MRIAHLILTRRFAGSERHAIELANAQATRHEVYLILRRGAAGSHADALVNRVHPDVRLVLVPDWALQWHAARALRRIRPDVAHGHLSAACKALHRVPGLCLRVGTLHIHYKPQQHAKLDALVAIAPWQLEDVTPRLLPHTVQMDNWVLPQTATSGARTQLRQEYGIPPDAWVFGTLGRVEPSKGMDVLIDAFERADLPNAWLVLVGQGRSLAGLRKRASARVVLPGFTDRPFDWLSAFDTFVSAARSEPFGLVFLEAMQAGLPVIASRSQGALHLAPSMRPTLVEIDDASAFALAMKKAGEIRVRNFAYELEPYRIEDKVDRLDAFYEKQLSVCLSKRGADRPPR